MAAVLARGSGLLRGKLTPEILQQIPIMPQSFLSQVVVFKLLRITPSLDRIFYFVDDLVS
jgi:hypothetical protein